MRHGLARVADDAPGDAAGDARRAAPALPAAQRRKSPASGELDLRHPAPVVERYDHVGATAEPADLPGLRRAVPPAEPEGLVAGGVLVGVDRAEVDHVVVAGDVLPRDLSVMRRPPPGSAPVLPG